MNYKLRLLLFMLLIVMIFIEGCSSYYSKELTTIEGKFIIEPKTRSWGMVDGILISGYDCQETPALCEPPKCKMTKIGCPYVNKTVKISGYLGKEDCIGG